MISRCPSCAAEVDDDAARCPSCHWDFELRKRVPPEGAGKSEEKPAAEAEPKEKPKEETASDPSPEPSLPTSAGRRIDAVPEAKPKKPEKGPVKDEPQPAAGLGLKQFGKLEKAEKPEKAEPPPREEPSVKTGFSIPIARGGAKEEYPGPPATEVRFSHAKPEKEKPEKEKPDKDRQEKEKLDKEKASKERQDAADRFKKRGKTDPKGKSPVKAEAKFAFDPKVAAAIATMLVIAIVGVYLGMRPEKRSSSVGAQPSANKTVDAVTRNADKLMNKVDTMVNGQEPDRDIHHVQRAVIDLTHPDAGAPQPPPAPPQPAPPTPAPQPSAGYSRSSRQIPGAAAPAVPAQEANGSWQFQGEAYDLITLKPVIGAQLSFRVLGGGASSTAVTDARGRFKVSLPSLPSGAYELTVLHKDYLDGYVDEMDPPLKESDLGDRRMQAASADNNARWVGKPNVSLKRDIILIPKVMPADLDKQ